MGAAQLNGQSIDLSSDLVAVGGFTASEGNINFNSAAGVSALSIWTGAAAPVGTLGGRVTSTTALYIRQGTAAASTVIYVTVDTGTTWAPITVP